MLVKLFKYLSKILNTKSRCQNFDLSSFFLIEVQQEKSFYLDNSAAIVLFSFYLVHSSKGNCNFYINNDIIYKLLQSE